MKRSSLAVAAAAAVLAVVPGAQAKAPPSGVDFCGASSCVHLTWQQAEPIWIGGGSQVRPLSAAAPYFVMHWRYSPGAEQTAYYVPDAHVLRWPTQSGKAAMWRSVDTPIAAAIEAGVAGLSPYPVSPVTEVSVGGRLARGPETYLRLLAGPYAGRALGPMWVDVKMRADAPSPWTDGLMEIHISAGGRSRLVEVDGWVHKVPWRVANLARRGLPLP
jgi:hypothetical protein